MIDESIRIQNAITHTQAAHYALAQDITFHHWCLLSGWPRIEACEGKEPLGPRDLQAPDSVDSIRVNVRMSESRHYAIHLQVVDSNTLIVVICFNLRLAYCGVGTLHGP